MRPILRLLIALFPFLFISFPAARAADFRYFDDAGLNAVQFVDDQEGWAVGDDGTIWHSIDGGRNWERQPSGVRASLRSVHFLNPYTGWVAGREELPTGGSSGVLLYTSDGGLKWRRLLANALPGLHVVRFVNDKVGYLAGEGADSYATGVFATADGGRSWQPVAGPRSPGWLAGEFNAEGGALVGAWNHLATVRHDKLHLTDVDALGGRNIRGLYLSGQRGLAVGQGGLLLTSDTGGTRWNYADPHLPAAVQAACDFHAVHGIGAKAWVVGRPGSVVLFSGDNGATWELQKTGQPLPLNGVFFRDERHGWAVGELGTILTTADGGKTWAVAKRGGERAAVLLIHARASATPLDTVALLGGCEGYLTAGLRVTSADSASAAPSRAGDPARFAAAFRQAGGAAAETSWQFPASAHCLDRREDLVQAWDKLHDDRAAEQMLRQMTLALRVWRPDLVITDNSESKAAESVADGLVADAVREAFRRAADPKAFPEQLAALGLSCWKPSKLYGLCDGGSAAQVSLDLTAVKPMLESSVADFASAPLGMLLEGSATVPGQRHFHLLEANIDGAADHNNLMQGISLAEGGLARRPLTATPELTPEITRAIRQRASLRAMTEGPVGKLVDANQVLAQLGPMLADLPDDHGARALHAVASQFARAGQWVLAREAFLLMIDRYPAHPLAPDAYRWLVRHNSSSEARRRHELGQFLVLSQREFGVPVPGEAPVEPKVPVRREPRPPENAKPAKKKDGDTSAANHPAAHPPENGTPKNTESTRTEIRDRQGTLLLTSKGEARKWYQGALDLESRLAGFGPLFANDPGMQFCLAASRRNLGDFEGAKAFYQQFAARQPEGPWRSAAVAELWLANRTGPPPKALAFARWTDTRPYLDGKLDDPCWQAGAAVKLQAAAADALADFPAEVKLAYDNQFLYVALKCAHPSDRYVPLVKGRHRDADLSGHDRVTLSFDLDRDYATSFRFHIDQRGCVAEDCWGDRTWDPRWFVAAHSDPRGWIVEAAIPLTALTGDTITSGRAWAFNAVRTIPGRGVMAWSLPAASDDSRPEGMGLLIFNQDGPRTAAMPKLEMMPKAP